MNGSETFQSNLPTDAELFALRHKAAQMQAAHIKALLGWIGAALFSRDAGLLSAAPQRS